MRERSIRAYYESHQQLGSAPRAQYRLQGWRVRATMHPQTARHGDRLE